MSGNNFFLKHNQCHLHFKKVIYEGLFRGNFDNCRLQAFGILSHIGLPFLLNQNWN